jgi:hypothetical protein
MVETYPRSKKIPVEPDPPAPPPAVGSAVTMLSPTRAWRLLCARTGGVIALVTFYRWVRNGRVFSIRMGPRIFIPQPALEDLIKRCLTGDRY